MKIYLLTFLSAMTTLAAWGKPKAELDATMTARANAVALLAQGQDSDAAAYLADVHARAGNQEARDMATAQDWFGIAMDQFNRGHMALAVSAATQGLNLTADLAPKSKSTEEYVGLFRLAGFVSEYILRDRTLATACYTTALTSAAGLPPGASGANKTADLQKALQRMANDKKIVNRGLRG